MIEVSDRAKVAEMSRELRKSIMMANASWDSYEAPEQSAPALTELRMRMEQLAYDAMVLAQWARDLRQDLVGEPE